MKFIDSVSRVVSEGGGTFTKWCNYHRARAEQPYIHTRRWSWSLKHRSQSEKGNY